MNSHKHKRSSTESFHNKPQTEFMISQSPLLSENEEEQNEEFQYQKEQPNSPITQRNSIYDSNNNQFTQGLINQQQQIEYQEPPTLGKLDTLYSCDEEDYDDLQTNLIPVPQEVRFAVNNLPSSSQGSTPFESKTGIPEQSSQDFHPKIGQNFLNSQSQQLFVRRLDFNNHDINPHTQLLTEGSTSAFNNSPNGRRTYHNNNQDESIDQFQVYLKRVSQPSSGFHRKEAKSMSIYPKRNLSKDFSSGRVSLDPDYLNKNSSITPQNQVMIPEDGDAQSFFTHSNNNNNEQQSHMDLSFRHPSQQNHPLYKQATKTTLRIRSLQQQLNAERLVNEQNSSRMQIAYERVIQINEGMKAELLERENEVESLRDTISSLLQDLQMQKDLNYQMMLNYESTNAASFNSPECTRYLQIQNSSHKKFNIKTIALDFKRKSTLIKKELAGLKESLMSQVKQVQEMSILENQVIITKMLKIMKSSPQSQQQLTKLDFEPKPNFHARKHSRRYEDLPSEDPLDTVRSDLQLNLDHQSIDSLVTEKLSARASTTSIVDSLAKMKRVNNNTPYKREMRLLKLDQGHVQKLERESAERDVRHSLMKNSGLKMDDQNFSTLRLRPVQFFQEPSAQKQQNLADFVGRELQRQFDHTDQQITHYQLVSQLDNLEHDLQEQVNKNVQIQEEIRKLQQENQVLKDQTLNYHFKYEKLEQTKRNLELELQILQKRNDLFYFQEEVEQNTDRLGSSNQYYKKASQQLKATTKISDLVDTLEQLNFLNIENPPLGNGADLSRDYLNALLNPMNEDQINLVQSCLTYALSLKPLVYDQSIQLSKAPSSRKNSSQSDSSSQKAAARKQSNEILVKNRQTIVELKQQLYWEKNIRNFMLIGCIFTMIFTMAFVKSLCQ